MRKGWIILQSFKRYYKFNVRLLKVLREDSPELKPFAPSSPI